MATYIKTLKEDNGDITYPQTKAEAVLLNNNSDLETELAKYVTAEEIGSTAGVTPTVTTAMIADEAVTDEKIDWSTIPTVPYNWMSLAGVSLPSGWANWVPIDVTNIPTGRKFVILFSFWWRGPAGIANGWVSCRSGYNGTYGGYAYSSQPGTEVLNGTSGLASYTKVAGVNTVYLQLIASNTTALSDGQVQGTAIF